MPQRQTRRRGVAAVEFAIVLPVLVAILLGTVECGRLILVQQAIGNAARDAARLAASGTMSDAELAAHVRFTLTQSGGTLTGLPESAIREVTVEAETASGGFAPADPRTVKPFRAVRVSVSVASADVLWISSSAVSDSASLTAKVVMRRER